MTSPVQLLETTLRDGGYEVDFQFTAEDTALIAEGLDRAGVQYIEICHGHGYGTERWAQAPKFVPAARDNEHIAAALSVVRSAKVGVLMIVGAAFTPPTALAELARSGVQFVRFGFLPDTIFDPACLAYIDRAKEVGLTVSINLMQTYGLGVQEVTEAARETARRGADWFYVVDSAGGMKPVEVSAYVRSLVDNTAMRIGLHAHNNSALATANAIAAVHAGATLVDATLQGIGRATGNPATEQMLLALQGMGHEQGIDREAILQLGDMVRPLFAEKGSDPTHFVSGSARVHSRHVPFLREEALRRGRSPRELVYQLGRVAARREMWVGESISTALIDEAASGAQTGEPWAPSDRLVGWIGKGIARASRPTVAAVCADLATHALKQRKRSVLHLVPRKHFPFAGPLPWQTGDLCGVTLALDPGEVVPPTVRAPELVLCDPSVTLPVALEGARRIADVFSTVVADAVTNLLVALQAESPISVLIGELVDDRGFASSLCARLVENRIKPAEVRRAGARCVLLVDASRAWPAVESADIVVVVTGHHNQAIDDARARGATVLRAPLAAAIAGRATAVIQLSDRLRAPSRTSPGVVDTYVAAARGEIVADDVAAPLHVIDPGHGALERAAATLARLRANALARGTSTL